LALDLRKIDVDTNWLFDKLEEANVAFPDSRVSQHIHLAPSMTILAQSDDSWSFISVDVIASMMVEIDDRGSAETHRALYVITPTDMGGRTFTHFVSFRITWPAPPERQAAGGSHWVNIDIMESSANQKERHGARTLATLDKLRCVLSSFLVTSDINYSNLPPAASK
jgi:hypothetical protein